MFRSLKSPLNQNGILMQFISLPIRSPYDSYMAHIYVDYLLIDCENDCSIIMIDFGIAGMLILNATLCTNFVLYD